MKKQTYSAGMVVKQDKDGNPILDANGNLQFKEDKRVTIELMSTASKLSAIQALQAERSNDEDCQGFVMATEVIGKDLRVMFSGIHADHVDRFEAKLAKHEKKA